MARTGWAYVDFSYLSSVTGPTGSVQFLVDESTLSGSHLFVYDTGSNRVGIGLTTFDGVGAGLPTHQLHVVGDVSVTGSIYADNHIIKNVSHFYSDGSSNFGDSTDDLHEFTGSVSITNDLTVDTTTFYVDSTNNRVGIGTASPTYVLDAAVSAAEALRIQGSTDGLDVNCVIENKGTSSGDDTLLALYAEPNAGDPSLRFAIAGTETWSMGIDNSDNDKLKISQASTLHTDTRLTIKPMGNVGIGTPDPTDLLTVSGVTYGSSAGIHIAADLNDDAYLDLTEHNGSDVTAFGATDTFGFRIAYDGASGVEALQFKTGNEATVYTRMSIKRDTGFVLIGGGAATGLLHVNGAAATGAPTLIVDHDDDDQKGAVFNIASKYDVGIDINLSNLDANGVDISADDVTTASAMHISADSLTTGNVLKISGTDGKTDLKIVSSADSGDYFSIATTTAGATTITTVDDDGQAADLTFDVDGDIVLGPAGGDVLPDADNTRNLGSASKRWANVYTGDLHLKNERGDWTVVEESEYLTLVNNANGKKYKIMMEEIED
tara:strand:+ start:291 stop:1937 length:1647 start_codon:yes stop_codon:yes gene_type:complete